MRRSILILALALSACASGLPEPRVEIREKLVPVAVSCVPDATPAAKPAFPDPSTAKEPGDLLLLLAQTRLLALNFIDQIWPVVEGCRRLPRLSDSGGGATLAP